MIELGAPLGAVEVGLALAVRKQGLLQCEPLPACAVARVQQWFTAVVLTPIERASSAAFQVCPCTCASMRQKRPNASGETVDPRPRMSRSRNVRVNDCIQRVQAAADGASQARGNPPRIHRRS